jgi:hypothetical protein
MQLWDMANSASAAEESLASEGLHWWLAEGVEQE